MGRSSGISDQTEKVASEENDDEIDTFPHIDQAHLKDEANYVEVDGVGSHFILYLWLILEVACLSAKQHEIVNIGVISPRLTIRHHININFMSLIDIENQMLGKVNTSLRSYLSQSWKIFRSGKMWVWQVIEFLFSHLQYIYT